MKKKIASLSLDLDNLWSYQKTHGEAGWDNYSSYLPLFVPRVLEILKQHDCKITFFVVGLDAIQEENHECLRQIAASGHEIGNHSFDHEPWMQFKEINEIKEELKKAEDAIANITDVKPVGFRGPGFCNSPNLLVSLKQLGYKYDASILPSILGPIARLYYLWGTKISNEEQEDRKNLFGNFKDGFYSLKPFQWSFNEGELLEIPVTTIPLIRIPFHLSYIIWLAGFSKTLAISYLKMALFLCSIRNVEPSYLLHPLDFLGKEDVPELSFFPGMNLSRSYKLEIVNQFFELFTNGFEVVPMSTHAEMIKSNNQLQHQFLDVLKSEKKIINSY